jgi:hypothetical protein
VSSVDVAVHAEHGSARLTESDRGCLETVMNHHPRPVVTPNSDPALYEHIVRPDMFKRRKRD